MIIPAGTEYKNTEYLEEVDKYKASPCPPCDITRAKRLLQRFHNRLFFDFWDSPVDEFFPAVSAGIMRLERSFMPHDKALAHAKHLITTFDPADLARAYLYGVAHGVPAYTTALASYHYIKNLPEHGLVPKCIGNDTYVEDVCEVCDHHSKPNDIPKLEFWSANVEMARFYLLGQMPFNFDLNSAILYLEEYQKLPLIIPSPSDLDFFMNIIRFIEGVPDTTTPAKLRDALKAAKLLPLTCDQLDAFIDMLGYLNILHPADYFGVTKAHIKSRDMKEPFYYESLSAYPVHRWHRSDGIDYDSIDELFGDCYR